MRLGFDADQWNTLEVGASRGWLRAGPGLKSILVAAGLPRTPPASRHGSSSGRTAMMLGGGLGFVLALGALTLYRRRK